MKMLQDLFRDLSYVAITGTIWFGLALNADRLVGPSAEIGINWLKVLSIASAGVAFAFALLWLVFALIFKRYCLRSGR